MLSDEDIKRARKIALAQLPDIKEIMRQVSEQTGVTIAQMKGVRRYADVTAARQLVSYIALREGHSVVMIARAMNKDRTTVVVGARREAAMRAVLQQDTLTD